MKKRIFLGLLVLLILSLSTLAFAKKPVESSASINETSTLTSKKQEAVKASQQVKENEKYLKTKREEIQKTLNDLMNEIKTLRKATTAISQSQIDTLKATVVSLKSAKSVLCGNHYGKMNKIRDNYNSKLSEIKKNGQTAKNKEDTYITMKTKFDEIVIEQESRKEDMQKLLDTIHNIRFN